MSIDKIKNIGLDKLVTQVYDFDSLTTDELMCKFAQKINIIIEHLKYIDDRCYNSVKALELKLQYLLGQGLEEQVVKRIIELVNDGTLGRLINEVLLKDINDKVDNIEENKSDIKVELLDTFVCNTKFMKLNDNVNYPILQGGCFSDDGKFYYCYLISNEEGVDRGDEKGIIQKYTFTDITNFDTWSYVSSSPEFVGGHGNDMTYANGKLYLLKTWKSSNDITVINPETLLVETKTNVLYGCTAITFNTKLNQFITRRQGERGIYDFYDSELNYIKTKVNNGMSYDTLQAMDSDENYIYELCSDSQVGNSIVAYDLKGNFVKRIGSNTMSEIENMGNVNGYHIVGFYRKEKGNFLGKISVKTNKRLTSSRYVLNHGKNTVLTDSTRVFNGTIPLSFSIKYYTHLSFEISVDDIEVEKRIIDITSSDKIFGLNTTKLTATGKLIFCKSNLEVSDKQLTITPTAYHIINTDGTTEFKLYSVNPEAFDLTNSISISDICGQVLCIDRLNEISE